MSRQVDIKALVSHVIRGDGVNRCRICMGETTEGQVYLSDTVMMDGERPVTLSEMLETVTGIQVQKEGDLPTGVCLTCFKCAIKSFEFRTLCHQAIYQWEISIHLLNGIPSQASSGESVFAIIDKNQMVVINDDNKDLLRINPAAQQFTTHVNHDVQKEDILYECPNCGKEFKQARKLNYHLKDSPDLKRACYICGQIMDHKDLVIHLINEHKTEPYDCKKCPALHFSHKQYIKHVAKSHTKGAATCVDCGRSFQTCNAYHAHTLVHTSKNCPSCDKLFRNHPCYVHHVRHCCNLDKNREDTILLPNKVTIEVKNKISKRKVKVGLRGSTNQECICDYCNKKFAAKKFVAAHIQIVHTKDTHRPCIHCGKCFAAAHMTEHMKRHELDRSYSCQHCSVVLRTKLGLSQHLRLHTGERPYACTYCGETFSASSRRSEHIRKVHKSTDIVLKHKCHLCPAKFRLPYLLRNHLKSVHNEDQNTLKFECDVCEKKFGSCQGLLHHSRKHQNIAFPFKKPEKSRMINVYDKSEKDEDFVQEEPLFPQGLCISCTSTAVSAFEFRIFVTKSRQLWTNCIHSLETLPTLNTSRKSLYAIIKENLLLQTVNNFEGNAKGLTEHLANRLVKRKPVLTERKTRHPRTGPACNCIDCGKSFVSPYYLNLHLRNSGQKEACLVCGVILTRGQEMREHLFKIHKTNMLLCTECPLLFHSDVELKQHNKKCHSPGVLTCSDCGRTFQRQVSFELHIQMHIVRTCRACGTQFMNRGCYREHRAKCEPDAKPDLKSISRSKRSNVRDPAAFTCDYCGKTYRSRPQLKNHILWIHMDVRPHQCQWCGKRFYTSARLSEHSVVHTRVRNFECDICGAKLVSKMAAVYHRRRHTGEKPYECQDCGEKFISSSRRSEHAKRRHNKGCVSCPVCMASFVRSHDMKRHIDKVHNAEKNHVVKVKKGNELFSVAV